ncbi:hypothetical protein HUG10_19675 (plasmid) [Halorarum halophilum]|uniref:DUF7344 domain-containing protein n=1 Tax=Halorarum halophilum TaxID=2743090 RepID=A0A7D5H3P8_9EURY|nr:hypothetical protein [Halobaculum halophilum]QLG29833.1 hypothetical protein HUG10_19675 [Halobaculum halophilum]
MAKQQPTLTNKRDQLRTLFANHHYRPILPSLRGSSAEAAAGSDPATDIRTDSGPHATPTVSDGQRTETGGGDSTDTRRTEALPHDIIFGILQNQRRRLVLAAVEEQNGSTTLGDLAEHIAGIENDKPSAALNAQERKRVYIGLYQCHLPKMADADAIQFDQHRGTIERGPKAEQFHEYLDRDSASTDAWQWYYSLLAGSSLFGFCLATVLFTSVSGILYGLLTLLLLVLAAAPVALRMKATASEITF